MVWEVAVGPDVGDDGLDLTDEVACARQGYEQIHGHMMLPVLRVTMPDGTQRDVDLEEVGLE